MTEPRLRIEATRHRTKMDNENKDQQEEIELLAIMEENKWQERNIWPGIDDENAIHFVFTPLFFLINLILIPTGFTFFLEEKESRDRLICRRHILAKAREVFRTIDKAQRTMGSKQTKQDAHNSTIEQQVGIENSYSILNLRNYHSSTIGILIIFILLSLGALWCTRKQYVGL